MTFRLIDEQDCKRKPELQEQDWTKQDGFKKEKEKKNNIYTFDTFVLEQINFRMIWKEFLRILWRLSCWRTVVNSARSRQEEGGA